MRILNFGSLNIDHVYQVEKIGRPGETIKSYSYAKYVGGKGLNQTIALKRAGADVVHAGAVGEDGEILLKTLSNEQLSDEKIKRLPGASGTAIIQVETSGQNSIVIFGGANEKITTSFVDEVFEGFADGDWILLQNEISSIAYIMEKAADKGMNIFFNPSPANSEILQYPLGLVHGFLVNESEAQLLGGRATPEENLEKLAHQYPHAAVVLTLGEKGVLYAKGADREQHTGYQVNTVDTTGAGDTFTGYYIASLMEGKGPKKALEKATLAAALSVTRKGAVGAIPDAKEVQKFKWDFQP